MIASSSLSMAMRRGPGAHVRTGWLAAVLFPAYLMSLAPACVAQFALEEVEDKLARRDAEDARRGVVVVELDRPASRMPILVVSGTVIDPMGYVVTAGLPAGADQGRILITDFRHRMWTAQWIGFDRYTGLTVLSIGADDLPGPRIARKRPRVGEPILVFRGTGSGKPVCRGTLRGLDRSVEFDGRQLRDLIEFAAPLSKGDAGAMLANERGELIGIVRGRLSPEAAVAHRREAKPASSEEMIGIAVPLAALRRVSEELIGTGGAGRGYLGVVVEQCIVGEETELRVVEVSQGAAADRAGAKAGDVLRRAGGAAVTTINALSEVLAGAVPGDRVALVIERGGEDQTLDVVLDPFPSRQAPRAPLRGPGLRLPQGRPLLGLLAQDLDADLREQLKLAAENGALVVEVHRDGPAAQAGIRPLDVVIAVDQTTIRSAQDLAGAVLAAGAGRTVALQWLRGNQPRRAELTLGGTRGGLLAPPLDGQPTNRSHRRIRELQQRTKELERYIRELEARLQERDSNEPAKMPDADRP